MNLHHLGGWLPGVARVAPPRFRLRVSFTAIVRTELLGALALLLLTTIAFWPFLGEGRVLVSLDAFAYFYPNYDYAADALRAGRIPLWNSYSFVGAPFLANSQTGVFYPFNLIFLIVPAAHAYAYSAALHTFLAGVFTQAFARRALGLSSSASFVAGATYALSGYVYSTFGHLNQLQALAWLPLLLLATEQIVVRSWRGVFLAALTVALIALAGHSQVLYSSLVTAACWALMRVIGRTWHALRHPDSAPSVPRVIRLLVVPGTVIALAVAWGLALSAVQLLPTFELAGFSVRAGGLDFEDAAAMSLPPWYLLRALLPSFRADAVSTEWVGYVGFVGLALALVGLGARQRLVVVTFAALAAIGLALALGQFNPVYYFIYLWVPGFDLFRVPARWLLVTTFALAALAGLGFEEVRSREPAHWRDLLVWVPGIIVVLIGIGTLALYQQRFPDYPVSFGDPPRLTLWIRLGVAAAGLVLVTHVARRWTVSGSILGVLLIAALCAELLLARSRVALYPPNLATTATDMRPAISFLLANNGLHRVLALSQQVFDPGDLPTLRSSVSGVLNGSRAAEYVIATKYRDTLVPNLPQALGIASVDGYDGGVLPLTSFVDLKTLFPLEGENLVDGRLNIQVTRVPPLPLLRWLNVRYVLIDRARDFWHDGVYYDTSVTNELTPGEVVALDNLPRIRTAEIGLVLITRSGSPPAPNLLEVTLETGDSSQQRWQAPAEADASEAIPQTGVPIRVGESEDARWLVTLPLDAQAFPTALSIRNQGSEAVTLAGLSLIAPGRVTSRPVPVEPDLHLRYLGDVKIYEVAGWQPRLYVVRELRPVAEEAEAIAALAADEFDPRSTVVITEAEAARIDNAQLRFGMNEVAMRTSGEPARAIGSGLARQIVDVDEQPEIVQYRPGEVLARVTLDRPALLVFGETWYPGWRAIVDGRSEPIVRVNGLYQAVALGAGTHEVQLTFQPTSFYLGALISIVAGSLWIGLGVWTLRKRRQDQV